MRLHLFLLITVLLSFGLEAISLSDFRFLIQPTNVTAREGEAATFLCSLESKVPFAFVSSFWENGRTERIHPNELYNVTIKMDNTSQIVASILTIKEVQREMSLPFKCWIMMNFLNKPAHAKSSRFARLNVVYFLEEGDLHCRESSGSILREGEFLRVWCSGGQTNPPIQTHWHYWGSNTFDMSSSTENFVLSGNLTVTKALHDNVLFCIATSPSFPEKEVNCSLGPFKVIHAPIVHVNPDQREIVWPFVAESSFQCFARAYPEIEEYTWFCQPEEAFEQCSSHSENLTVILDQTRNIKLLTVSCEARNHLSSSRNSSTIHIRDMTDALVPDCNVNSPYIIQTYQSKAIDLTLEYNVTLNQFYCATEVKNMDNVIFKWYLAGKVVAENQGKHVIVESSQGGHLMVFSTLKMSQPGLIVCEIHYISDEFRYSSAACQLSSYMTHSTAYQRKDSAVTEKLHMLSVSTVSTVDIPILSEGPYTTKTLKTAVSNRFWNRLLMIVVPIGVTFALLLCLMFIIMASQRVLRFRNFHPTPPDSSTPSSDLVGSRVIITEMTELTAHDRDENAVYETPDIHSGFQNTSMDQHGGNKRPFALGLSRQDVLFEETSATSSSMSDEETYEDSDITFPTISTYENHDVIASTEGSVKSKYYWARQTGTRRPQRTRDDCNESSTSSSR